MGNGERGMGQNMILSFHGPRFLHPGLDHFGCLQSDRITFEGVASRIRRFWMLIVGITLLFCNSNVKGDPGSINDFFPLKVWFLTRQPRFKVIVERKSAAILSVKCTLNPKPPTRKMKPNILRQPRQGMLTPIRAPPRPSSENPHEP